MASSYQHVPQDPDESIDHPPSDYPDEETLSSGSPNGFNYHEYRRPADSLKGKIEQKYWKGKQTVIEKFGKSQDLFVVAGDAEVDARLEAFRHIQQTCVDLLKAVEIYQKKIFTLSQEENESGRFLREQGSVDKTKAGKMMISVGKALSYTAQQRLTLRVPLVRLFQEVETFRHRAVGDTWQTVNRMERLRSEYRAALLWMADISKQLDPEEYKRLDKYREVQSEVKVTKKKFDKCKVDVIQKVDLLSASRCNLLSATLVAYQHSLLKFWENTSTSLTKVYEQFRGHPSYQFQMLKHIIPDDSYTRENDVEDEENDLKNDVKEERISEEAHVDENNEGVTPGSQEEGIEAHENGDNDDDDTLISLDASPLHAPGTPGDIGDTGGDIGDPDLLGGSPPKMENKSTNNLNPSSSAVIQGIDDLLGLSNDTPNLAGFTSDDVTSRDMQQPGNIYNNGGSSGETGGDLLTGDNDMLSADDLLFNDHTQHGDGTSFSETWNKMFGGDERLCGEDKQGGGIPTNEPAESPTNYLPSDLIDSFDNLDPYAAGAIPQYHAPMSGPIPQYHAPMSGPVVTGAVPTGQEGQAGSRQNAIKPSDGGNHSAWLNLFSDLDPLSNPDAIGQNNQENDAKRSC